MKTLILSLTMFLAACGGGSAGINSAPHVVDSSPHTYTVVISDVLVGTDGILNMVHFHQVCNFNLPGLRDETSDMGFSNPNGAGSIQGGVGCGNVNNYTVDVTNNGVDRLDLIIQVDGVTLTPDGTGATAVLQPGQNYNFQRGF